MIYSSDAQSTDKNIQRSAIYRIIRVTGGNNGSSENKIRFDCKKRSEQA
jgi:hypothetical protein